MELVYVVAGVYALIGCCCLAAMRDCLHNHLISDMFWSILWPIVIVSNLFLILLAPKPR